MAKLQLKRSNVLESGVAKAPSPGMMEFGELAVNFNAVDPKIFIKDSNGAIIAVTRIGQDGKKGEKGARGWEGEKGRGGYKGLKGEYGNKGERGEEGLAGEKGIKGQKGPKGHKGRPGNKGNVTVVGEVVAVIGKPGPPEIGCNEDYKGSVVIDSNEIAWICLGAKWEAIGTITGPEGPKGVKGDYGQKGEKGATGGDGQEGAEGIKGNKGNRGIQGPTGRTGIKGEKGETGNKGPQGLKGNLGSEGIKGEQGNVGTKGIKGSKGDIGVGLKGAKGAKGPEGQKGTRGIKGNKGKKGEHGEKGVKGTPSVAGQIVDVIEEPGPPNVALCILNGDIIVDSEGVAWVCNLEKGWISIGAYKGTQGQKGAQGIQGIKGTKGELGTKGPKGAIGIGQKGNKGNLGAAGFKGIKGAKGKKGQKGVEGETGVQGVKGEKGEFGLRGIKGEKGKEFRYEDFSNEQLNNLKGETGEKGEPGDLGAEGDKGKQGIKGKKGEQGREGEKGYQGQRGIKGNKGEQGESLKLQGTLDSVGPPELEFPPMINDMWLDANGEGWVWDGTEWKNVGQVGGPKGKKGEQGIQGIKGEEGEKGDAFVYDDFTGDQIDGLKGEKGERGVKGRAGDQGIKGDTGEAGKDFTYDDFTSEQLDALKGEQGQGGTPGEKGDPLTWDDLTQEQQEALKGNRGERGDEGPQGLPGVKGDGLQFSDLTPEQINQITGEKGNRGDQGIQGVKGDSLKFSDLTPAEKIEIKGDKGNRGNAFTWGDLTDPQKDTLKGKKGEQGDPLTWNDLTEAQKHSLKGERGEQGTAGTDGKDLTWGDLTQAQKDSLKGNRGEQGDALTWSDLTDAQKDSLKGNKGKKGEEGDPLTWGDLTDAQKDSLKGNKGRRGEQGIQGEPLEWGDLTDGQKDALKGNKGRRGEQGIQGDDLKWSDLTEAQKDALKGDRGEQGDALTWSDLTDAQKDSLKGERGNRGVKGNAGTSVTIIGSLNYVGPPKSPQSDNPTPGDMWIDTNGDGWVYSDSWTNVGPIQGPQGPKGDQGDALTWGDLTPAQRDALKGNKGRRGAQGTAGNDFTWGDLTQAQKDALKGQKGKKGEEGDPLTWSDLTNAQRDALKGSKGKKGEEGDPLTWGDLTNAQKDSLKGSKGKKGEEGDPLTWGDLTNAQRDALKGQKGKKGEEGDPLTWGDLTNAQKDSLKGNKGRRGAQGIQGEPLEWGDLTTAQKDSLKGERGAKGARGQQGNPGSDGSDANAGNGQINISAGNGLSASGSNARANQTGNTTRTLSAKLDGTTLAVSTEGLKVNSVPWGIVSNKPSTYPPSSHSHSFNSLTSKTSGTGTYSTDGILQSGRGSGGVALTINDGQGNANVTFNHVAGVPEQDGNAARIVHNADSTSNSAVTIEVASNVKQGVTVSTSERFKVDANGVYASNTKFVGDLTGNADTATSATSAGSATNADEAAQAVKLKTSRTLWGQSFNGTANVSGALTGATSITGTNATMQIQPADSTSSRTLVLRGNVNSNGGGGSVNIGSTNRGQINLYTNSNSFRFYKEGNSTNYVRLRTNLISATRTISFPNQSGTIALTTDIPTVPSVGNGAININAGNGLSAAGDNATANQSGNTTRTLSAKLDGTTLAVSSAGLKVNSVPWTSVTGAPAKYPDADKLDGISSGSFLRSDASDTFGASDKSNILTVTVNSSNKANVTSANLAPLSIRQNEKTSDCFIQFYKTGYASYFGLDHETNDLFWGGWSAGAVKNKIWHAGNDGAGSGLDADQLEGYHLSFSNTKNTVVGRNGSGDITTRLFRSTYQNQASISGAMAFRISNGSDNYIRFCNDTGAIRTFLEVNKAGEGSSASATNATNSTNARIDHDTGNQWHRPVFIDDGKNNATNQRLKTDSASTIGINPSTNRIRASRFDGPLEGTASNADKLDEKSRPKNWGNDTYMDSTYEKNVDANAAVNRVIGSSVFCETSTNTPFASGHLWTVAGGDTADRGIQFFSKNDDGGTLWMRGLNGKTWHKVWTAGNDGSGSGLNADKLDDLDSSKFMRKDVDQTVSGVTTFNKRVQIRGHLDLSDNQNLDFGSSDDIKIYYSGNNWLYCDFKTNGHGIAFRDNGTDKIVLEDSGVVRPSAANTCQLGTTTRYWAYMFAQRGYFMNSNSNQLVLGKSADDVAVIHRNDGGNYYILLNTKGMNETFNSLRPFYINTSTGQVTSNNGQYFGGGTEIASDVKVTGQINMVGGGDKNRYIDAELGTKALYIRGTTGGDASHKVMARFKRGAECALYHNNTERILTTSYGAEIKGAQLRVTNTGNDDQPEIRLSTYRPAIRFNDISANANDGEIVMDGNYMRFKISTEVNDTTALTQRMYLNNSGTLTCTGDVVAYSDARVKKNIEPITNALSKVEQLNGVTFERTDSEEEKRRAGLIAQDVEKVLPEVIHETEDGIKSVAYGNITGLLVEAIKDLKAEIKELKAEIKELKNC